MHIYGQRCSNPSVRKEWRELSQEEKQSFIAANICLKSKPSRLPKTVKSPSVYDDLVYVHIKANTHAHGNSQFLVWHRHFMVVYQRLLKIHCQYNHTIPYWDISVDSQAPEKSVIFNDFGHNGRPSDHCLTSGPFGNWTAYFPSLHCLSRKFDLTDEKNGNLMGAQYSPMQIEYILSHFKTYEEFRKAIEEHPHNMVHYGIGGDMFDPKTSLNDPIFWLHHVNVDRMWYSWQVRYPHLAYTYNGSKYPNATVHEANQEDVLTFYGLTKDIKVSSTFDPLNPLYCYVYSNSITPVISKPLKNETNIRNTSSKGKNPIINNFSHSKRQLLAPNSSDRKDTVHLRTPVTLSDEFLDKMNYSTERRIAIRNFEKRMNALVSKANALGWKSDATLIFENVEYKPTSHEEHRNRIKQMQKLLAKVDAP